MASRERRTIPRRRRGATPIGDIILFIVAISIAIVVIIYGYSFYGSTQQMYRSQEIAETVRAACNVDVPYTSNNESYVILTCMKGYTAEMGIWPRGFNGPVDVYVCKDFDGDGLAQYPFECNKPNPITVFVPDYGSSINIIPVYITGGNPAYVVVVGERTDESAIYVFTLIRTSDGYEGYLYSRIPVPT